TLNREMRRITGETLLSWGLLSEGYTEEDVKNYYWHNTGHHLGLDVHDICEREAAYEEGNCLAIEPGVYIKEWGIGFRIEDDVRVKKDGCELLSSGTDSDESIMVEVRK
nr:M24 family metallopeptidase [Saccharofermentans sp.]